MNESCLPQNRSKIEQYYHIQNIPEDIRNFDFIHPQELPPQVTHEIGLTKNQSCAELANPPQHCFNTVPMCYPVVFNDVLTRITKNWKSLAKRWGHSTDILLLDI